MPLWDDIRYFLALARNGSLSGAARTLGVEHSTVARRVGQLEAEVEARLFDRLPRGWQLTANGHELVRRAEAIEEAVLGFHRSAAGADPLTGTVRVSAPPMLLSNVVVPGVSDFIAAHPAIALELIGERREADLRRAEVDIAIRLGRPTAPELVIRSIGDVSYGLYGLARWMDRPEKERAYLGFDASMPDLPQKLWLEEQAAGVPIRLRSNDLGTLLASALAGHGLALLPDVVARRHPDLKPVVRRGADLTRPAFLVMHPDLRRSARVRITADFLFEVMTQALRSGGHENPEVVSSGNERVTSVPDDCGGA